MKGSVCEDLGGTGEVGSEAEEEEDGDANLLDQEGATAGWEGEEEEGEVRGEGEEGLGDHRACVRRVEGEQGQGQEQVEVGRQAESGDGSEVGGARRGAWKEEGEVAAGTEEVVCVRTGEEGVRTGEEGEAETEASSLTP